MSVFERPLFALSLTEQDRSLLAYSALVAERFGWGDLHFAHVATEDSARYMEPLRDEVRRYLGEPGAAAGHSYHALDGPRLDQLLRLAVEHSRDVIMLGHRRMRSGRRSLARRLAMISPASVWLVPEDSPARISCILVPVDFSPASGDALAVAAGIARTMGLEQVYAVHVFFDPSTVRYDEHVREVVGQEEAAFQKFIAGVDTQGVGVDPLLVEGTRPATDILHTASRYGCDLVVMSTRGRSQAASVLLGSTTSETMAATTVPLVAVKHFGSSMTLVEALTNHRIREQPSPKTN